jgi:purine-binding chemotaxis protein CheW
VNQLFLIVTISGRDVALQASEVQSVIELETVTDAPRTPDFIRGLSALRSRPLTVIDCAKSLELDTPIVTPEGIAETAVVVEYNGHLYALHVDGVKDVTQADSNPNAIPVELKGGWERVALGMVEASEGGFLLIDVGSLIEGPPAVKAA